MKRVIVFAMLFAGCMSYVPSPSTTKSARIEGYVMKNDTARMIIYLAPPEGETSDVPLIRYNSLTLLDRRTGVDRVENLQAGEFVIVFGRQNEGDDDIIAERIAVQTTRP